MTRWTRSRAVTATATGAAALMVATGVVLRDAEAVAIGALVVVGYVLLRFRRGLLGRIALGALFVDIIGWMAPAAWSNASHGDAIGTFVLPLLLVVVCLAGLAAVIGVPERAVAAGAVALLVVALVGSVLAAGDADNRPPGAVSVSAHGVEFSPERIAATSAAGSVTVVLHNKDLFWHTFTIDALDVSVRAPLRAHRAVRFAAAPGTYEFYCAIPGHKAAGMKGTLVVS